MLWVMAIFAGVTFGLGLGELLESAKLSKLMSLEKVESALQISIYGFTAIFILDVIISFTLYYYYQGTEKSLSLGSAIFRMVYSVILLIAIISLVQAKALLNTEEISSVYAKVLDFKTLWTQGLIVFGFAPIGLWETLQTRHIQV